MTETTRRITYEGDPATAGLLAHMLEEQGVRVEWDRPFEQRGADMVQDVIVGFIVAGGTEAIRFAVQKFKQRMPRAKVKIEDDDD